MEQASPPKPVTNRPSRLLLIEDEEAHAELLSRAFEDQSPASISIAPSLAAARRVLAREDHEFDLIVSDLRLPDGLGMSVVDERGGEIPVIIMTSQGDERAAVEAIKRGAYDYIVKSVVAFEEMPRRAERVIREWRHVKKEEELQKALAERERLAGIGTTAAMLAHEIGNPLNTMALTVQLIERRLARLDTDTSEVRDLMSICRREVNRLAALLEEFRELARQRDLQLKPTRVAQLLESAIEIQRPILDASQVEVVVELPEEPIFVLAHAAKMTQVLINLCKNAVEAMGEEGGRIELSLRSDAEWITLTVTDEGPGVPDDLDLFTPFATTKEKGSGLGLAIVAQILMAHGGRVYHERPGEGGARFCLELQRAPSPSL